MKSLLCLLFFVSASCSAQFSSFVRATLGNKNVYRTKEKLEVFKAYSDKKVINDATSYWLRPTPANSNYFLCYKVVGEDDIYKYIRILPGCHFGENKNPGQPNNEPITDIIFGQPSSGVKDVPEDFVFKFKKKEALLYHQYLGSSSLVGKLITLPIRVRKETWDVGKTAIQGTPSLSYGFGWKIKVNNNPFKNQYLNFIPYAAGVSAQKYFKIAGKYANGKDSLSAKADEFAITYYSGGISYETDKFNFGLFAGKDAMLGNQKDWIYQRKWWFGIGIGYELFK